MTYCDTSVLTPFCADKECEKCFGTKKSLNADKINSFHEYCVRHPEERFWQALRNWSGHNFILKADKLVICVPGDHKEKQGCGWEGAEDTFYDE